MASRIWARIVAVFHARIFSVRKRNWAGWKTRAVSEEIVSDIFARVKTILNIRLVAESER